MARALCNRRFLVPPILYVAYFFAGVATVLLGPALPHLAARWPISDALAGSLFAAQFGGGILGTFVSTRFQLGGFVTGLCISALAIGFLGWVPWNLAYPVFFFYGTGLGSIIASGNILVTQLNSTDGGSPVGALAMLHLAWGVGAMSCPWLFRACIEASGAGLFFALLGGSLGLMALGIFLWGRNWQILPLASGDPNRTSLSLKARYFYAIALLLYTGAENAISGWLPSYVTRMRIELSHSGSAGALAFSLLWGGILTGRAMLPLGLRFLAERTIYNGASLSLLISLLLLMAMPAGINAALWAISAVCGLSLAGIYPLLMGRLLQQSGGTRGIGWVLACASIGGASLPWVTGLASAYLGSLRAAITVPSLAAALLLFLAPPIYAKRNPSVAGSPGSLTYH